MKQGEKGYTLIELLITITIMALATAAAAGGIYQIMRNTERNSNHMTALIQVQNAGNRITQDVQTAQTIITVEELTDPEFLVLGWVDAGTGDEYEVIYTLEDMDTGSMKKLMRSQSVNDTGNFTSLVSQNINTTDELTSCNYTSGIFNLTITSSVGGRVTVGSETRIYRIFPRPG